MVTHNPAVVVPRRVAAEDALGRAVAVSITAKTMSPVLDEARDNPFVPTYPTHPLH